MDEYYRSEIRQSEISGLEEKVSKGSYGKYLKRVTLRKVRGFTDRTVTFDFPVTAVVGPNGGGKSTVLGAAALAYKSVSPGRFFAKGGKHDASMQNWSIEYEVIDKGLSPRGTVARTARFKEYRWSRDSVLDREVKVFGVDRTLPATERAQLKKAARAAFSALKQEQLHPEVAAYVARILGKPVHGFEQLYVDQAGNVTLFSGRTQNDVEYTEFHFGAGEASVIRIVAEVEAAQDGSMILIEEIENGLHPVATRRMVEYLIGVAKRKGCQVVFTTHSNDALAPLPPKGIWAAYDGEVLQGKLDVRALRTITGQIDAKLAIFVEDKFAETMVITALRAHGGVELEAVKVHSMGGADPAIQVHQQHNLDPTRQFTSVCVLDGDQAERASKSDLIFCLPGDGLPEAHVLDRVMQRLEVVSPKLALRLQLTTHDQERVKKVVQERALTNWDRHVIWEQIGDELDFQAGSIVAGAFLATWAEEFPDEVAHLVDDLGDLLPKRG
ncbi:AAA family ATPase [Nocardia nova]|uniref:AAA family ATPase n=1 Tax=Nocardia nova TaxID=37330 RepID=A0A2S6APW0_9NOCA|nr:ATP-binding protein [Nocardia nova]PPJ27943.1 AAA family ATPase [Nocardia nova]PPJ37317.1 AAA family ATPase [Nocardia nova]